MSRRAFTLLELLVAMAVLVLLLMLLASVANHAGRTWQEMNAGNERRIAARAVLRFMANELRAASQPLPMPGAGSAAANLQMIASLPTNDANATAVPAALLHPHALFWQAPLAQNASFGDIASTGYFVRWDTSQPGLARPVLCRFFSSPEDASHFLIYQSENGSAADWLSVHSSVAPATAPEYRGWLSDHVIALWIRFLDRDGQPITRNAAGKVMNHGYGFDSRQGYRTAAGIVHPGPALPPCVEIALVVVDSRTAAKITTPLVPQTTTPADFDKSADTPGSVRYFADHLAPEIKAGAQVFFTRVFLPSSLR